MNTVATIAANKITVNAVAECDGQELMYVSVPNGWDDVKNLTNKVLTYNGRDFTFTGWNSDRNEAYFKRPLRGPANVAVIR